ncbi:MAG TPA: type IV pilus secretin PilQ [Burkholderiaceae bacterium]|nr:type IV pilus secretin PilQ [Burkholderiaceae bacterium]
MSMSIEGLVKALSKLAVAGLATFAALSAAQTPAADATNAIERVDASQTPTGVVLTIDMKNPVQGTPASFSVANPARVALDLPGAVNAVGRNQLDLNQGDLRSVNIVQAPGRSRVVLNLKRPLTHAISVDGNRILVALGGATDSTTFRSTAAPAATAAAAGAAAAAPAPAPASATSSAPAAPTASAGGRALRGVDFRRGAEGEGRVVIDLSDPNTNVDIRQQGNTVVVDFLNTTLPDNLKRRLDVSDFATPVSNVTASQQGNNARLVIEPRGLWEHNAYQSDTRFVLEVRPVKEDPNRLFQGTRQGYQGERLSLNFQNVDVRSLLQVIADFTNLNIITSDSVGGTITLRLKDVPWDQALDIILQSKGLDMRKNGNVLLVAPRDEIATKEKLELESRSQIQELEPLRSEAFVINYQKAEEARRLLVDGQQRLLSKRGTVAVDPRTNQLFVQDTVSRLEEVRRLLARIDVPVPQVLIEARIVEADDKFSRSLGVKFGYGRVTNEASVGGRNENPVLPGTPPVRVIDSNNVNLPAIGLNGFNPGSFNLTLFNSSLTRLLNLELTALESDGAGKVISSPRVVTADKVKATIEQGTEIPYQQATSSGATSVAFRKAVLKLEVTPQITPEGAIFMDVKVNKDTPGRPTTAGPAIDTKNVQTQVLVENGGTVVLGGIYEQSVRTDVTKVPFLGDIPVLGYLFKTTNKINDRTELLIFITPRIVSERINAASLR